MAILSTGKPGSAAVQIISLNSNSILIRNQDTGTKDKPDEHKCLPTAQVDKYVDLLISNTMNLSQNIKLATVAPIPIKQPSYINGIPRKTWTEDEFRRMNIVENLQNVVIGTFSYRWPEMDYFCEFKFPNNVM
uniref:Uncharacterized protein n=1 Tax=Solanum lycopersicum TaxID=4081 RepID=A0A3Q7J6C4_SOLLC